MTKPTRATITIEIEVPVSGTWVPAEPDVGLDGWFEDAWIDFIDTKTPDALVAVLKQIYGASAPYADAIQKALDDAAPAYADAIQEALAEARQGEKEDAADARYDEMRDRQGE